MLNLSLFGLSVLAVMPRHTHILTNQNMYILSVFVNLTPFVQALFSSFFFFNFSLYTPMGRGVYVTRRDSAHATPKVKLRCIPF